MSRSGAYLIHAPSRAALAALGGPVLLEFGAADCAHCRAADAPLARVLASHPALQHLRIADGPGRRLGRLFQIKLWPTFVLLDAGIERVRLVRPRDDAEFGPLLASLARFPATHPPSA